MFVSVVLGFCTLLCWAFACAALCANDGTGWPMRIIIATVCIAVGIGPLTCGKYSNEPRGTWELDEIGIRFFPLHGEIQYLAWKDVDAVILSGGAPKRLRAGSDIMKLPVLAGRPHELQRARQLFWAQLLEQFDLTPPVPPYGLSPGGLPWRRKIALTAICSGLTLGTFGAFWIAWNVAAPELRWRYVGLVLLALAVLAAFLCGWVGLIVCKNLRWMHAHPPWRYRRGPQHPLRPEGT